MNLRRAGKGIVRKGKRPSVYRIGFNDAEYEYEERKKSEKVQWGKDMCAAAGEDIDELPEQVFISISDKLEDRMLENNGDLEYAVVQEVVNEFWEQEVDDEVD